MKILAKVLRNGKTEIQFESDGTNRTARTLATTLAVNTEQFLATMARMCNPSSFIQISEVSRKGRAVFATFDSRSSAKYEIRQIRRRIEQSNKLRCDIKFSRK